MNKCSANILALFSSSPPCSYIAEFSALCYHCYLIHMLSFLYVYPFSVSCSIISVATNKNESESEKKKAEAQKERNELATPSLKLASEPDTGKP